MLEIHRTLLPLWCLRPSICIFSTQFIYRIPGVFSIFSHAFLRRNSLQTKGSYYLTAGISRECYLFLFIFLIITSDAPIRSVDGLEPSRCFFWWRSCSFSFACWSSVF